MPDLFCYSDYERSEELTFLLIRAGKLCTIPDCNQPKYSKSDTGRCYAHHKEERGLIDLDTHYKGVC